MMNLQPDIDVLTALGQQLRIAYTALDEAANQHAEHDLENAFFDGALYEKLTTLTAQTLQAADMVADILQSAIRTQAEHDVQALVDRALQAVEAVDRGTTFGFPPLECAGCPDEPECTDAEKD